LRLVERTVRDREVAGSSPVTPTNPPMFAAFFRCAVLAVLIALPTTAPAAGKGTARGPEAVHVREQPSLDSPSIVTLSRGRAVTVEKVLGPWALVVLDSGRRGYVKAAYLELP